jgi:hypothetical protein
MNVGEPPPDDPGGGRQHHETHAYKYSPSFAVPLQCRIDEPCPWPSKYWAERVTRSPNARAVPFSRHTNVLAMHVVVDGAGEVGSTYDQL